VSHRAETRRNSWLVLRGTSRSLTASFLPSETRRQFHLSEANTNPQPPPRPRKPVPAGAGRHPNSGFRLAPGSRGARRLVVAAALLEGSAQVGSAGAERSGPGWRRDAAARGGGSHQPPAPAGRAPGHSPGLAGERAGAGSCRSLAAARLAGSSSSPGTCLAGCALLKGRGKASQLQRSEFLPLTCHEK